MSGIVAAGLAVAALVVALLAWLLPRSAAPAAADLEIVKTEVSRLQEVGLDPEGRTADDAGFNNVQDLAIDVHLFNRGGSPVLIEAIAAQILFNRPLELCPPTGGYLGADMLYDIKIGRWCAATLTGTGGLAAAVAAALTGVRPVRPSRVDDVDHWATIGGALGQRLAFATQHAPPYYALLGAHRAGLTAWATLARCAAAFPTHTALDPDRAARANQLRPLPGGRWVDLDRQPGDRYTGRAATGIHDGLVLDLVERLVVYLAQHAPPGRLAGSRGAEARLARACVVLTDWETAYRTGQLPDHVTALVDADTTVPDLLDAVPDHQVAELVELAIRADRAGVLARLAPGIAGPVFVEHWADGDLLIPAAAGGGMLLLDVKTVTSARDPDRVARWLWQLLGYAWLDPTDRYRIRSVGALPPPPRRAAHLAA